MGKRNPRIQAQPTSAPTTLPPAGENALPVVSFRYAQGGKHCLSTLSDKERKAAVRALRKFTSMAWSQVRRDGGLNFRTFDWTDLSVSKPDDVIGAARISKFSTSERGRIYGFREHNTATFMLMWADDGHEIMGA